MCNRYRLTAKQAEIATAFGVYSPYAPDETFPVPDIFPTGNKTPFYGTVIVQSGTGRTIERMEWGVPTQVPSKRDPAIKLTKYVTNVRNLSSSFWRSMLTNPARRCLVVNRRRTGTPDRSPKGTPLWRWRASTLGAPFALLAA